MTEQEIEDLHDLVAASGRRNMPVPLCEWREMMLARIPAGQITIKDGKVKVRDRRPKHLKIAQERKAKRAAAKWKDKGK